ncbi:TetR/AcrR family transcriptional regulator [Aquipuribacter nitratireducens]|uniref:TetR/AcrR family transcriptional regulator n=1 Tax=Aquipuribacter nitratireducens TaxID=650104 RepID=A0ABW0GPS2_9MICO
MPDPVKRRYRSPRRTEQAALTRAQLREAAADLFLGRGFAATTMRAVAQRAGVGERTLYDAFPTKVALFEHVVGVAIVGDEQPVAAADRPELAAALAATRDGREAVRLFTGWSADLLERAGALIMVAVESAGADPAMRRFADDGARQTRVTTAAFVRGLVAHGVLDADREAEAAATTFALCSPHVHQLLRREAGRTETQYREWLDRELAGALLE